MNKIKQNRYYILLFVVFPLEFEEKKQWIGMFIRSRLRLFWAKLWIRKDEFHWTLDTDYEYLETSNPKKHVAYFADIVCRRNIAHKLSNITSPTG